MEVHKQEQDMKELFRPSSIKDRMTVGNLTEILGLNEKGFQSVLENTDSDEELIFTTKQGIEKLLACCEEIFVRELVANTMPLITDQNITELVTALPKGMRLMRVAVDALSGPDLSVLLDDGFPVKDLLKDANQTRELLTSINMTSEDIELTLDSSIQLPQMGLAMSELGRLDIGEILGNIGGLLANLQSSNILHQDAIKMVAMILEEIKFDQIDTKVITLLIEDLEPLYRDSEWSMLIQVLKELKLPSMKEKSNSTRRIDTDENGMPSLEEKEVTATLESSEEENEFNIQQNKANIFETVLGLADVGIEMLKFLPHNDSVRVQNVLKYFAFSVDVVDVCGLAIHQNDHQARRRFVERAQTEIAVVPDFHKQILFSDEAHFWLNGYVNKQNCCIWSEANPQVYVETPLHPEKLTLWCALWAGGILL
ncbi:ATP-binding cassette sub-family A member 1 [Trichonephila clavipes]|nr:ATP-binding cassette sub-family A member 1 [Trichonephila clavipes]